MKKINPFILLSIVVLVFTASCNKTHYCECREGNSIVTSTPIKTLGKMGAKSVCDSYEEQANMNGARQTCSLK